MTNIENFTTGKLIKHKNGYEFFLPNKINQSFTWQDSQINNLLEKAAIKLGALNSFATLVPNIDLFIRLHTNKEATISSKIEGTKTDIDESFLQEDQIEESRRNDWREVSNYIKAMNQSIEKLEKLPISSRLIKQSHDILMQNVRGQHKMPGQYRTSQNWIGGSSLQNAYFIPPSFEYIEELMSDLENFIHNDKINVPDLIKIAIIHYQFETIHPFLDGNGRIGRLLITLFLQEKRVLTKPLLYLSTYFERNKGAYYDKLTLTRTNNDLASFIKYFLTGIIETSTESCTALKKTLELKQDIENEIYHNLEKKTKNANLFLNYIFKNPVFTVSNCAKTLEVSYTVINDLVNDFGKIGILKETTGQERNRIFAFRKYLDLF